MTIIDVPFHAKTVTPKRPTVATPVLVKDAAEKCIAALDEDLDFLYCIANAMSRIQTVPDEAVNGLRTLHTRMKRNVETLYTLG